VVGIRNAWRGTYVDSDGLTVVNGTSLYALVASVSQERADALDDAIEAALEKLEDQVVPFDQAILGSNPAGRQILLDAITLLSVDFNEAITRAAEALDVDILTELLD